MNRYIFFIAILSIFLSLNACKSKTKISSKQKDARVSDTSVKQIVDGQKVYKTLEYKASARTVLEGKKYNFTVTVRNKKNEVIWISVKAMLGIEVARVKCTPEEVWILSRLAGVKEYGTWEKMKELLGYPIDFYALQGLLTNGLFNPNQTGLELLGEYMTRENHNGILFIPNYSSEQIKNSGEDLAYWPQFLYNTDLTTLLATKIVPHKGDWLLHGEYSGFDNGFFDRLILKALDENQNIELNLKVSSVLFDGDFRTPNPWK